MRQTGMRARLIRPADCRGVQAKAKAAEGLPAQAMSEDCAKVRIGPEHEPSMFQDKRCFERLKGRRRFIMTRLGAFQPLSPAKQHRQQGRSGNCQDGCRRHFVHLYYGLQDGASSRRIYMSLAQEKEKEMK